MNVIIVVLLIVLVAIFIISVNGKKELFDTCGHPAPTDKQIEAMGKTAKEVCNKISSKAEEIEAHYKGTSGVLDSLWGALSPANYKAGDNTTEDMVRNIINTNLSSCDIQKISNDCVNSSASTQANIIDNSQCEYCKNNLCEIKNVTQENKIKMSQKCSIQSAMETLLKKTSSVDAQALAQVLQKSQDILSGSNNFKKENCNTLNADMSNKSYLEHRSNCANKLSLDQNNSIKFCGNVTDIIQKNQFDGLQECILSASGSVGVDTSGDIKSKTDTEGQQENKGLNLDIFGIGNALTIGLIIIVALICLSSLVLTLKIFKIV